MIQEKKGNSKVVTARRKYTQANRKKIEEQRSKRQQRTGKAINTQEHRRNSKVVTIFS